MTIRDLYPDIKPSLNLDFANTKSLDPRIDFTRASTATYYDGVTHAKAEENLLFYSQEFDGPAWSKINSNIVANTATAPDGTVTAEEIIENNQDIFHLVQRSRLSSAGVYTFSCHLKANTRDYGFLILRTNNGNKRICVTFDLLNGSVVDTVTQGSPNQESSTIEDVGNGWYRCSVTLEHDSSDNVIFLIGPHNDGTNTSVNAPYQGDGTSGIFIWGAQLEQRDTPTAYTATTDAPITNYIPVLKTASTNEPRFDHDPITGESLGLLIESQRTNLLTYSEQFDNGDWFKGSATVTANTVVAPDGTVTGDKLVSGGSGSPTFQGFTQTVSALSSDGVFSVHLKSGEITQVELRVYGGTDNIVIADLSTQTFLSGTGTIQSVGNGWYRVSISVLAGNPSFRVSLVKNGNRTFASDGYSGVYIWGAQFEEGEYPTSYIKTEGSEVTRIADVAQITGDNFSEWYRQDEGTVFGEFKAISEIDDGTFGRVFDINDGTNDNSFRILRANDFDFNSRVNGQSKFFTESSSGFAVDDFGSFAFAVSSDSISVYADGNESKTETDSNNLSTTVDRIAIGANHTLSRQPNAHIKRLTYYPKRLPNTVLQALTEE